MKIEIWSDVMCPFCYIGKRKFEAAVKQFEHKNDVEVIWKSYQLNPYLKTEPEKNINEYLAEIKGCSIEQAKAMNDRVTEMAKNVGLNYNFETAIVANSFDAHRLIQFAKSKSKGAEAEEALFKAYFTEGKNTADKETLMQLGADIGLNTNELFAVLNSSDYSQDVAKDIAEAQQIGVRGVPFFVIDRKYGISGAQETETFSQALHQAWEEADKN